MLNRILRRLVGGFFSPTKSVKKLFIMSAMAMMTFGFAGLGAILMMYSMSFIALGRDAASSHGISSRNSSRLGGLSILIIFTIFVVILTYLSPYTSGLVRDPFWGYFWSSVMACALLGLVEDVEADFLSPGLRLGLEFVIFGALFWLMPSIVPEKIGVIGLDSLFQNRWLAWATSMVFCVGFINAFNMSDGANGLIPGIALAAFICFFAIYGRPAEGVLVFACAMFFLFNVISGWFFLGDTGSYGLGAIIALYGLLGVSQGDFSAGFMACLLAYPCIDFLYSILRRIKAGVSPLHPDNGHLHNRLHRYLVLFFKSKVIPNSLTGIILSGLTSGVSLVVFFSGILPITSNAWFMLFFVQLALYVIAITILTRTQRQ